MRMQLIFFRYAFTQLVSFNPLLRPLIYTRYFRGYLLRFLQIC